MKTTREACAADLMQRDVLVLQSASHIEDAIASLEEGGFSGAPVVDGGDRLVGVFSLSDVAQRRHMHEGNLTARPGNWDLADEGEEEGLILARDDYSPILNGRATVGDWMHPGIVSVKPDAGLREICRILTDNDMHRVLVVENSKLVGIITSLDVVRHVANG